MSCPHCNGAHDGHDPCAEHRIRELTDALATANAKIEEMRERFNVELATGAEYQRLWAVACADAKKLQEENRALRESLIHACELRGVCYANERELWAMREAANQLAEPFTHERVQEKYDEWPTKESLEDRIEELEPTLDVKRGLYAIIYNDDNGATAGEVNEARAWLASHGIVPT